MKFQFLLSVFLFLFGCESSTTQKNDSLATEVQNVPFKDVNIEEFKKLMSQPDVVLLDVRTPEEVAAGKIDGALEIDIQDSSFEQKIRELDKDKTYLVYCAAGGRSATSCRKMAGMGFKNLYNLKDGYDAWSEAK